LSVKESEIVELLPAQRDLRISMPLDERTFDAHDAAIVICSSDTAAADLRRLPYGAALARHYDRQARNQSCVSVLSTHLGAQSIPCVLAFVRANASMFDQLSLGARAWKVLATEAPRRVLIGVAHLHSEKQAMALEAFLAAVLAGSARLPTLKSKRPSHAAVEAITLCSDIADVDISRAVALDRGNHVARWLTALPPNVLDSASYRGAIASLARRHRWGFNFLNVPALRRQRAGAFLAVARANDHEAAGIVRLVRRARDRKSVRGHIALVGKGICFDTGGINLKPHKSMYLMHEDMQGSAVALGTLLALSELDAPFDVDCWLAITENNIGPRAYRPQEVVTAANGTTIQVVHSDAEGRMALADTLVLASRAKPDLVLDFATLTGACVTALTDRFSGVFTNRPEWHAALEAAGRASGERVWPFPMDEDFDAELESAVADVLQCTIDSKGDHILAARFLSRFVPAETPWIHVDLAASNRRGGLGHIPTEYTGFGVRFAVNLLLDQDLLGSLRRRKAGTARSGRRRQH
jgi:leucyl aminopeptidase